MPKKSFPFVKITYFDKEAVLEALGLFCAELQEKYPEVEEALVFGSLPRGECVPGSDVDLLLILTESSLPLLERIPRYMPDSFPVGIDIFPYTREELAKMLEEGNPFITKALREGQLIYKSSQGVNLKQIQEINRNRTKRKS